MNKNKNRRSDCPISYALDLFGDRWSLLIVRDLIFYKKQYYGEFLRSDEGISTNILADRLSRLESMGVLTKERDPEDGKKNIYRLTLKGQDLLPIMVEMIKWAGTYDPETPVDEEYMKKLQHPPSPLEVRLRARLMEEE